MLERILKQYGVDKVSARTKISKKHLLMLVEKNFEDFSKPQAYGFVSILQREYGDDFEDLKKELDAWFCEGEECKEEIFVAKPERSGPQLKKIVGVAVLILLLMAVAMFFTQSESGMTKSSLPKTSKAESTEGESHVVQEVKSSEAPVKIEDGKSEAVPAKSESPVESEEVAKGAAEPALQQQSTSESGESKPYVPMESAVVTPIVRLWFGVIDLETKKRVAKTTADPYEIDPKGRKLLITGHGRFEISDSFGNLFKFNDAKKHYFLIDDGMVKEISEDEFRRLNGGRVW